MTIGPQKRTKIPAISNVHADFLRADGTYCSIGWTDHLGFRYHFWTVIPVGIIPETLYKNCREGLKRGDPDHFDTRYLNPTTTANAGMIAKALAVVERDGLIAKLIESEKQKELAEEAESKETQRIAVIQAAGVDLYEALKGLLDTFDETGIRAAEAAIAKAEGGAS